MADASRIRNREDRRKVAAATIGVGEIHQLADGLAGVKVGAVGASSGDAVRFTTDGQFAIVKATGVVLLDGGPVYWDHSANAATFRKVNDRDFFLGACVGDAASADTSCTVNLNVRPVYEVELTKGVWTAEATNGLGVTPLLGGGAQLAFDAVAEAAQAAFYSERTFNVAANCIFEARFAIFDKGDNAALDIDLGLASATHATDFEAIAEFVSFHFDGNALDIKAQSDDGSTDVAVVDTTVDAVDDTYLEVWIDTRDPTSLKLYVNGVRVASGTTFSWAAAAGPVFPIVLVEKTSDDTLADVRIDFMRVRTAEQ